VVLDDPVVNDRDIPGRMRVRIVLARPSVGRPPGVADAGRAVQRTLRQCIVEVRKLADGANDFDGLAIVHGEARRVVPPVFELTKSVDQDRGSRAWSNVSDDSAHSLILEPRGPGDNLSVGLGVTLDLFRPVVATRRRMLRDREKPFPVRSGPRLAGPATTRNDAPSSGGAKRGIPWRSTLSSSISRARCFNARSRLEELR